MRLTHCAYLPQVALLGGRAAIRARRVPVLSLRRTHARRAQAADDEEAGTAYIICAHKIRNLIFTYLLNLLTRRTLLTSAR